MDPALRANGYHRQVTDADGIERELVANPVQFDETPARSKRAPQFAEHTDEVLRELGKSEDEHHRPEDRRRDHLRTADGPR